MRPVPTISGVVPRLAAALVALASFTACSGGGGHPKAAAAPTSTTLAPIGVTITKADGVPDPVKVAVQHTLDAWLQTAVVAPLRTGTAPAGLDTIFTAAALARVGGPDHAALVEDGASALAAPPGTNASTPAAAAAPGGTVTQDAAEVTLVPLVGPDGNLTVVDATITISLTVTSAGGRVAAVRTGDLVLTTGDPWKIDSYDIVSKHDTLPPPATTTTLKKRH